MARIVTRVTSKNFCIVNPSFELSKATDLEGKNMLKVEKGQACINGMDLIIDQSIRIYPPDKAGDYQLALHLWRDSSDNVLGDLTVGVSKQFKGVYLDWWNEKDETDTDALWLGKVHWNGKEFTSIEEDLDKYGRIWAKDILCKLEDWKHPNTSRILLQDWIYKTPDWYVSKEGDVMFGPLELLAGREKGVDGTLDNHQDIGTGKYGVRLEIPDRDTSLITIKAPSISIDDTNNKATIRATATGIHIHLGATEISVSKENNYDYRLTTPNEVKVLGTKGVVLCAKNHATGCRLHIDDTSVIMGRPDCTAGEFKTTFSEDSITQKLGEGIITTTNGVNKTETIEGNSTVTVNKGKGTITYNAKEFHVEGDITAQRVYNAVYNDLGEYMEKADYTEEIKSGDVVMFTEDGKVTKVTEGVNSIDRIAGIVSSPETLGFVLGGAGLKQNQMVPVALAGRVYLNTGDLDVQAGDLIAVGNNGQLKIVGDYSRAVLGKATKHSSEGRTYVLVKI